MAADYQTITDYRGILTSQGALVPSQVQQAQSNANAGVTSWLEWVSAEYARDAGRWVFSRDAYTGELLRPQKMPRYLIRKVVGETAEAYDERLRLSDYTPHFGAVVDSLIGMLFSAEVEGNFDWGALGDPKDHRTPIGQLQTNADGAGNGYKSLWKLLAADLTAIHKVWVFVDGGDVDNGRVTIRIVEAEAVINERWENGTLVEAIVQEEVDVRQSIEQDPKPQLQWVRFDINGWSRWCKNIEGQPKLLGSGKYYYEDPHGMRALPIFPCRLPLKRPVGYLMARKAVIIFNQESTRDHGLRFANFPILNIFGNDVTYKKVVMALKDGARALQNQPGMAPHNFIAPSGEPARILTDVLEKKVAEFWGTSFHEFNSAAGGRSGIPTGGTSGMSATQSRYQSAHGVEAYLALLKGTVDEAENGTLWRLEQTYFPDDRSKWFRASVERSDDFVPFDVNQMVERLRTRYFGQNVPVPIGRTGRIQAAMQIAEWDGIDVNQDDLQAQVDIQALNEALTAIQVLYPELPTEAKAEMAVRLLVGLGYVKPDDTSDTDKDQYANAKADPLIGMLRARALVLAKAKASEDQQPPVPTGQAAAPKPPVGGNSGGGGSPSGGAPAAPGTPNNKGEPI